MTKILTGGSGVYTGSDMTVNGDSSSLSSMELAGEYQRLRRGRHTFVT